MANKSASTKPFYIVDVFAESKYAGNQLAVFPTGNEISSSEMQQIAKETNFAETTFIMSDTENEFGYPVRIFTPEEEIPFAGHPTLGSAFIIRHHFIKEAVKQIRLHLGVGTVPVDFIPLEQGGTDLWMQQASPSFSNTDLSHSSMAELLQLDHKDLDQSFPVQVVSTGLPFCIIPVKGLDSLKRARLDQKLYDKFIERMKTEQLPAYALFMFCPETYSPQNQMNVRMFGDYFGVPEDAATGSANGCFLAYLLKHNYFKQENSNSISINLNVEQGYEIGRPSLLKLNGRLERTEENTEKFSIRVGGKVQLVAKGEWHTDS